MPPELARLDPDARDWALALAVEIVTAPQPILGLTQQQAKLVRLLQSRPGFVFSREAVAQAVQKRDAGEPTEPRIIDVIVCRIRQRRPDLGKCITLVWGEGFKWMSE